MGDFKACLQQVIHRESTIIFSWKQRCVKIVKINDNIQTGMYSEIIRFFRSNINAYYIITYVLYYSELINFIRQRIKTTVRYDVDSRYALASYVNKNAVISQVFNKKQISFVYISLVACFG
jgi:hypothetical protein